MMSRYGFGWRPYVPVGVRRARARKQMEKLRKKGKNIQPVEIEGRKIARTFWGEGWCKHLEKFSDYSNRLPRGRTYVRNGSVCHLEIKPGAVNARVAGSEMYNVSIKINDLPRGKWREVKKRCAGQVGSLLELLQGRLSKRVMEVVTDRGKGLFPLPKEIRLNCSCPDWAVMCKHVAATLYGVGARLDEKPESLFILRGVDHEELISAEADMGAVTTGRKGRRIADCDLSKVFGIEMAKTAFRKKAVSRGKGAKQRLKKSVLPRRAEAGRFPTASRSGISSHKGSVTLPRANSRSDAPPAQKTRFATGRAVARLRAKFGMPRSRFARLLGVSAPSVGNWEKAEGRLNLQARTLKAWAAAARLTKRAAWKRSAGA